MASARVGEVMAKLILAARVSSATTKEVDAKRALLEGTKQLGIATIYLIQDVKSIATGQDIGNKFEKDFQVCFFSFLCLKWYPISAVFFFVLNFAFLSIFRLSIKQLLNYLLPLNKEL